MSRNLIPRAFALAILIFGTLTGHLVAQNYYSQPNNNAGCPSTCRQISWLAGSDLWNRGTLPTYTSVACTRLHNNGTTDDSAGVQTCINALSSGQCALLPTGLIYINGTVRLKSNTCLRGQKAEGGPPYLPTSDSSATTIVLGSSEEITTQNFSPGSGDLYPASPYATFPTTYCTLSGTPQKGDTTLTLGKVAIGCDVSAGTWIEIYGNDDPTLIDDTGEDGHCDWCGNNNGFYVMEQIVQVTAINSRTGGSGSNISISRPLYYTPYTSSVVVPGPGGSGTKTEPAGAKYSIITFPTTKAGFENLRFDGSQHDIGGRQIILLQGCLYCCVKNVETYGTGGNSGSAHVEMDWTYGDEIRDSALHDQRSGASGAGYGVYFQFVNSDAKVEKNIIYHNRA